MWKERFGKLLEKFDLDMRDIIVFLMSLLLAFSIWLLHNLSLDYSSTMAVPVIAECNLEGHSDVSSNSSVIAARCRTTGFSLLKNKRQNKRSAVHIRFSEGDMVHVEGETFSISSSELANYMGQIFGDDVRLEAFLSDKVQFRFPFENNKRVPVQAVQLLSFKSQYMPVGEMRLEPDSITIYGEPFHLDNIDFVATKTVDLENLHSSAHGVVKLEPVKGVRMSEDEVKYSLDVTRFVEIVDEAVITMRNVPVGKKVSIYPSVAKVIYKCAFPLSENPSNESHFYIDYKDFESSIGGKCVPRLSRLPSGVIEYSLVPEVFECVEEGKL